MRATFTSLTLVAVAMAMSGCATIVHNGARSVEVASTPAGARVSIYDRDNRLVETNTTPFIAYLPSGAGYFKSQSYVLSFELAGYQKSQVLLDGKLSGWYWGNLVFGGLIGMLIVDPLTGAMYNLTPDQIQQPLTPTQAGLIRNGKGFMIVLASELTDDERQAMVRIN